MFIGKIAQDNFLLYWFNETRQGANHNSIFRTICMHDKIEHARKKVQRQITSCHQPEHFWRCDTGDIRLLPPLCYVHYEIQRHSSATIGSSKLRPKVKERKAFCICPNISNELPDHACSIFICFSIHPFWQHYSVFIWVFCSYTSDFSLKLKECIFKAYHSGKRHIST